MTANTWIVCEDCNGTGRDTAGHNFAYTGDNYACENCDGQGGWEAEETISTKTLADLRAEYGSQLTEVHGDPLLKRRAA